MATEQTVIQRLIGVVNQGGANELNSFRCIQDAARNAIDLESMLPLNERGHTLLITEEYERFYFLARLTDPQPDCGNCRWLEISLVPENYPSLNMDIITATEEKMAIHIMRHWEGASGKCQFRVIRNRKVSSLIHWGNDMGTEIQPACEKAEAEDLTTLSLPDVTCPACLAVIQSEEPCAT